MGKMQKKAELLADRLELPSDILAGSTKLTITGRRHMLVENHRGIISYGEELIELDCGAMTVRIRGDELRLAAMDKHDMCISGRLLIIELD